jgi:hypothetical protein
MLVLATILASASLAGVAVSGQTRSAPPATRWIPPRTPDGHPDLAGIWEHNAATPLERPTEIADRPMLTDDELAEMNATAAQLFSGDGDAAFGDDFYLSVLRNVLGSRKGFKSRDVTTGDYNSFWNTGRWFEKRTSLITNPLDGKLPPLTADARQRREQVAQQRQGHPYDGPESIGLFGRCITGSVPMLGAGYNNYYQIVQAPAYMGINMEMRHDSRMVPITTRPHLSGNVRLWLGDPIGRWQGDTFVVDSTNFRTDSPVAGGGAGDKLHVVERFTRAGPTTLKYEVTVEDPSTWTAPWTAVLYMRKTTDQIYEYACHEANYAMYGTLNGARVQEKKERAKSGNTTAR